MSWLSYPGWRVQRGATLFIYDTNAGRSGLVPVVCDSSVPIRNPLDAAAGDSIQTLVIFCSLCCPRRQQSASATDWTGSLQFGDHGIDLGVTYGLKYSF